MITVEATQEATAEATVEATPTASPTKTPLPPTATPTEKPAAVAAGSEDMPVILHYDDQSLILMNRSERNVNVSDWSFVQSQPDGSTLTFEAQQWEGGNSSTSALAAGECFQVQRNDIAQLANPDYCDQQSWARVSFPRWFWKSNDTNTTFEVRRDDEVLATCLVSAGECGVELPQ
jgi:hypothetical protein